MPKIIVSKNGPELIRVHIDGNHLDFGGGSSVTVDLDPGEHVLTWFVQGTPGVGYRVAILEPADTRFTHDDRLDSSLRDAGMKWFQVK